jgi:hypothetical protein
VEGTKAVAELAEAVAALDQRFADAEAKFKAAHDRWMALNEDYQDIIVTQAWTKFILETVDAAIGVVSAGPGWPAALVFEAGHRVYEGVTHERADFPTLSDDYIALRDQLSRYDALAAAEGRPPTVPDAAQLRDIEANAVGAVAPGILAGQGEEAIKGAVEQFFNLLGDVAAPRYLTTPAGKHGYWPLLLPVIFAGTAGDEWPVLRSIYRSLTDDTLTAGRAFLTNMTLGPPTGVGEVFDKLTSWEGFKGGLAEIGGDVALSALVTFYKDMVYSEQEGGRLSVYHRMAMAEIAWFVARNEYVALSEMRRRHHIAFDAMLARLGRALDQRAQQCCLRRLVHDLPADPATAIWVHDGAEPVVLEVTLSRMVEGLRYRFAADAAWRGFDTRSHPVADEHAVILGAHLVEDPVLSGDVPAGTFALELAGPDTDLIDADPITAISLGADHVWQGAEAGSDAHHSVTFVRPMLALKVDDPSAIEPGAILPVEYLAPPGVAGDVAILIGRVGTGLDAAVARVALGQDVAPSADGPSGRSGTAEFIAPTENGDYEIWLYGRVAWATGEPMAMARVPFHVGPREVACAPSGDAEPADCAPAIVGSWFMETYINDGLMGGVASRIDLADGTYAIAIDHGPDQPPGPTIMTCAREALALDCTMALRDRYLTCREQIDPVVAYRFAMAIVADGSRISGEHPWTLAANEQCQVVDLSQGGVALTYRYVLTRVGTPPDADASTSCDPFEDDNCPDPLGGLAGPGDNE